MTDLDTLRPEVLEAVREIVLVAAGSRPDLQRFIAVIRAELLRLADYEQAAGRLAIEKAEFRQRAEKAEAELAEAQNTIAAQQGTMGALKRKLALAEGELAALKARIAEAQECGVVALCGGGASLSHEPYPSLVGKRVRLVVDDPPAGQGE